jgi:hypothetical protein
MSKLEGIPHIFYFNLDKKTDRKKYMEDQFEYWGIKNFTRLSASKYTGNNMDDWSANMVTGDKSDSRPEPWAHSMMHFDFFKEWLSTSSDPYLFLMEDDYDLSLIEYWHFDWNYLMSKLPYDWDCIQLGFESSNIISFYLHPISPEYSFGPCLMKREHVEKLLRFHSVGDIYRFDYSISNYFWKPPFREKYKNVSGSSDYLMCHTGKTYCIPLIALNPYFTNWYHDTSWEPKAYFQMSYDCCHDWWKYDRDNFTLDEFFSYGKSNDILMQRRIEYCDAKYFVEKAIKSRNKFLKDHGFE